MVQKKSLFMFENKTKEMYLFSQNVFLFYFIKNKIKVVENVASRRTAIFNMNIWALHHIDSLIPIPEIRIFTNYFTNLNIFCKEQKTTGIVLKCWKNCENSETREIMWFSISIVVTKIMIILFEKNGAKNNNTYN